MTPIAARFLVKCPIFFFEPSRERGGKEGLFLICFCVSFFFLITFCVFVFFCFFSHSPVFFFAFLFFFFLLAFLFIFSSSFSWGGGGPHTSHVVPRVECGSVTRNTARNRAMAHQPEGVFPSLEWTLSACIGHFESSPTCRTLWTAPAPTIS